MRADGIIWMVLVEYKVKAGNIYFIKKQDATKTQFVCRAPACEFSALYIRACTAEAASSFHLPGWYDGYLKEIDPASKGVPAPCTQALSHAQAKVLAGHSRAVPGLLDDMPAVHEGSNWFGDGGTASALLAKAPPPPPTAPPPPQLGDWGGLDHGDPRAVRQGFGIVCPGRGRGDSAHP